MTYFILQAHAGWRWVVLILLVVLVIKALVGWFTRQNWSRFDSTLLLTTRISVYIQVILGLILYILLQGWTNMRLTGEHVVIALLAVGALEFGAARAKKVRGRRMYLFALIGAAVALVLIYVALQIVGGIFT
jgi:hypothetical protein